MALGGVSQELSRGGDSSRHRSKESPPWVCEKCAKKHDPEMGCGETTDEEEELGCRRHHATEEDEMGCDKCKEGQRRKRKRAAEEAAAANLYGAYRVMNTQAMGHTHRIMIGQTSQEYTCPVAPPVDDPTLHCQRDKRGNAVCSDGRYFPPGCPNTPPDSAFTSDIAEDEVVGGVLQAKIPAPRGAGASSAGGVSPAIVIGAGALGLGLLYMLFR